MNVSLSQWMECHTGLFLPPSLGTIEYWHMVRPQSMFCEWMKEWAQLLLLFEESGENLRTYIFLCNHYFLNISWIHTLLSVCTATTLGQVAFISRLGRCNSLLVFSLHLLLILTTPLFSYKRILPSPDKSGFPLLLGYQILYMLTSPCCLAFAQLTSLVSHYSFPHPHPNLWKGPENSLWGSVKSVGTGYERWGMEN